MRDTLPALDTTRGSNLDVTTERSVIAFAGIVLAAVTAGVLGGVAGIVAAVLLVGVWVALPAEYAFAAGHVALVAASPDLAGFELLVGVQAGLLLVLISVLRAAEMGVLELVAWTLVYALTVSTLWSVLVLRLLPIWQAVTGVVVLIAMSMYVIHRHQLGRLDAPTGVSE
ncbi:hypothetical protein ACFQGE_11635 [Halomicroarcula sp. GCM10025817]|uniref:hypothetical protein n=1 Tax=Haloarcula TaxID=2237 RepID=UPI0023E7FEAF|nr:hypothetical protein [Halomicroarcula sp. SYNS111]